MSSEPRAPAPRRCLRVRRRGGAFAELAAQAIANAEAREELGASRERLVEAGDAARRRMGATAAIAALVAALVLISLGIGPVRLSPRAVTEALFGSGSEVSQVIVREIRLPRTLLALAILIDRFGDDLREAVGLPRRGGG